MRKVFIRCFFKFGLLFANISFPIHNRKIGKRICSFPDFFISDALFAVPMGYCPPSLSLRYFSTSARTISRTRSFTPCGIVKVIVTFGSSSFFFLPEPSRRPPHVAFFSSFCIFVQFCLFLRDNPKDREGSSPQSSRL